jgi:hypothetical protein
MQLYGLQVVICEESHDVHDMSFVIYIARCMPMLTPDLLPHASGIYIVQLRRTHASSRYFLCSYHGIVREIMWVTYVVPW